MTRRSTTSLRRSLVALPVLLLALAACGGSDGDGASIDTIAETTTSDVPASDVPADTTPVTDVADTVTDTAAPDTEPADTARATTPDSTTTTLAVSGDGSGTETDPSRDDAAPATDAAPVTSEPVDAGDPGDCLVGAWVITNAEMNAYYSALAANSGDGMLTFDVPTGQVQLTFTPDAYQYTADFEIVVGVSGIEGTGVSTGTVSGTWEGSDGVVTTTLGESNLDVQITVAGQVLDIFGGGTSADGSAGVNSILESAPINDAPYSCAGPTPTIEFLAGAAGERHPVTLTPA